MVEILLYSYLTSIHIYICGYIFSHIFINKNDETKNNIFELFFYGSFLLCFLALFLNFFFSLNEILNTFILILPFILFLFFLNKKFLKKIFLLSFPISLLFLLTIAYDGTYRPDAGSYHLPYISILNDSKIIIGINNIHYRFGHTSIIQYLSAIYNNVIFGEKGIVIPLGLIYCNFIGYCIYELSKYKNNSIQKIIIFLIFSFVVFRVNRYSDFGNDAPANLLFFFLIIETIKNNEVNIKIKKTIIASTFILLNKVTLLLGVFIPIFLIFKNFDLKKIINKVFIFSFVFIFFYIGKNILISGCAMFPIEQTCLKNLYWYDSNSKRGSNAVNARIENEAWTKGWVNQKINKKSYKEYLKNFNWINTWIKSEGKTITKKILPFTIFLAILLIPLIYFELRSKNIKYKDKIFINNYILSFVISILGSVLWFYKFPVFRYGYAYLISFLAIGIAIYFKNYKFFHYPDKFNKLTTYLIIFLMFGICLKNFNRIYKGINKNEALWPNIYNSNNIFKKKINLAIKKNNEIIFYKSIENECYYSIGPCTHFYNGNDFKLNEIGVNEFYGYKVYYFNKKG